MANFWEPPASSFDDSSLRPLPPQMPVTAIREAALPRYTFPPGLVGEVAEYVLSSAIRPVPEVALAAAIALCAGVCGRSYNISGTGLNQYIILLAKTGRGKEGAATGIDNLMAAVRQNIPMADQFIGPAAFASGQALIKTLDKQQCFVSILGEVGFTFKQMCDPKAPGPQVMLKRVLLDIYAKSGFSKVLRSSVYSDSEKNTRIVQAPNVTILGESTPETFFSSLDASHITEGLIPRFSIIEYNGPRPIPNENPFHPPSVMLIKNFAALVATAVNTAQNHTCSPVSVSPEAKQIFDKLNAEADRRINSPTLDTEAELWNRAHLKALKLAALVAVGCNMHAPNIIPDIAEWACAFVRREIGGIMERFKSGDIGSPEAKQESEIRRLFDKFQTFEPERRRKLSCPECLLQMQVCPERFLTVYSRPLACFKNDRRGPGRALKECLEGMVNGGILEKFSFQQLLSFGTKSPIYYPGKEW
ncbi:MAG: hypothetical protein ACFUZC_18885 [Chthoniobacteraceae bacterium]